MIIKKNTLYGLGAILIVIIGISLLSFSTSNPLNSNVVNNNQNIANSQNAQVVKLSVQNGQYILEPSQVKKDAPVRIIADINSMPGCSKSLRIPSFGVSKTFTTNDNTLVFTPNKAGTFNIACSMNMYKGTFTVLESDGSASGFVEQKLSGGSTCGSSDGGCGCGG